MRALGHFLSKELPYRQLLVAIEFISRGQLLPHRHVMTMQAHFQIRRC